MESIVISSGDVSVSAELNDTPTAQRIAETLPLEGKVQVWGEEIYFMISLEIGLEAGSRADVEVGDLGYWPSGPAFCIFFGPTPMSTSDKPRAAGAVNIFGRVIDDCAPLRTVSSGATVRVQRA